MDAVNSPEPAGTDLTAPEFAARLRRETEPGERRRLLAEALRDFLVRAGALGADAGPETPAVLESLAAVELNAVLDACLGLDTELETLRGPVSAGELAARLAERLPEAAVQAPVEGAADGPGGRPGDGAGGPSAGEPGEAPGRAGDGNASGGTARAVAPGPERRHEPFGLTDLQQAYLLGRSGDYPLATPAVCLVELDAEDLDVERLEAAWQTMIARHPMLRTVCTGDGTRQRVLPESETPPYRIARHDLRDRTEPERERHLDALREEFRARDRAPHVWPLFDVAVTRLDARRSRVHLTVDLLVADGPSIRRLLGEWLAAAAGREPEPVPDAGFREWVRALEEREDGPAFAAAWKYWLTRVPDLPDAPALPMRVAPEAVEVPRASARTFRLDGAAWARLRRHALDRGLTPSMALCWAYGAVLRTWSGQDRCTLNVTVNDRSLLPGLDRALGAFTSQLLLEVADDAAEPVRERIGTVQERFWADFAHRAFSGVRVLRELARRSGGGPAAVPYVFDAVLGGPDLDAYGLPEWYRGLSHLSASAPQVAVECQVFEVEGELRVHWGVVEELFPPGLIDTAFSAFTGLVEDLAQQPDLWETGGLNLVPASDLAAREAANATDGPLPQALLHELGGPLRDRGDHPAVLTPDRTLTYAELDTRAARIAHHLRTDRNAKPGELVAIVMHKGWEQAVAALGILQSGAAYLPLDAAWPTRRL
ncbi:condensation domain-containing protein, partial [Streptomyces sp. JJ36]|uniref:condensation domain-containing protein n=1 Tax=Streptomyces sp. JJ36 TaxID=2736645 RepID=UPI001F478886